MLLLPYAIHALGHDQYYAVTTVCRPWHPSIAKRRVALCYYCTKLCYVLESSTVRGGGYKTEIHMLPLNEMIAMDIRWDKTVQAWSCEI